LSKTNKEQTTAVRVAKVSDNIRDYYSRVAPDLIFSNPARVGFGIANPAGPDIIKLYMTQQLDTEMKKNN